jgi:hypothetical protein
VACVGGQKAELGEWEENHDRGTLKQGSSIAREEGNTAYPGSKSLEEQELIWQSR